MGVISGDGRQREIGRLGYKGETRFKTACEQLGLPGNPYELFDYFDEDGGGNLTVDEVRRFTLPD